MIKPFSPQIQKPILPLRLVNVVTTFTPKIVRMVNDTGRNRREIKKRS